MLDGLASSKQVIELSKYSTLLKCMIVWFLILFHALLYVRELFYFQT
jgi:uncharacterized membrane protein